MTVSPAEFKIAKPQFAAVPDATVQAYLDMAARLVDTTWGDDQDAGQTAMACHLMTLEGLGTDPASISFQTGAAAYESIKSGQLTLTRYARDASSGGSFSSWLELTPCGQFYALLLRMNRGGPRVAYGGGCQPITAYAKDWPYVFFI